MAKPLYLGGSVALLALIPIALISFRGKPLDSVYRIFSGLSTSDYLLCFNLTVTIAVLVKPFWMLVRCIHFIFYVNKFHVGDEVEVNGRRMRIDDIHIAYTLFRVDDDLLVRIPNLILMKSDILNLTRNRNDARNLNATKNGNVVGNSAAA